MPKKNYAYKGKYLVIGETTYIADTLYEDKHGNPLTLLARFADPPSPDKTHVVLDMRGARLRLAQVS